MGVTDRWSSLRDQVQLAGQILGPLNDQRMVADWLREQVNRVENLDFAREFTKHVHLPGITEMEYAHRYVRTTRGDLLGGIRFYGRDIGRPFIDVLAHGFDDVDALTSCVLHEWSNFDPPYLRTRTRPGLLADRPDVILDKTIHLARYRHLTPADGRVTLDRFDSAEQVLELVAARYARLAEADPVLANNLSPAEPEDLRLWHRRDQLRAIRQRGNTIGVLAVVAGTVGWISGEVINEEVVSEPHGGHGYAASAQSAWAHCVAADTDQLLIGTIDRHNRASRATALRAGRPRVLDDVFIALRPPTPARERDGI